MIALLFPGQGSQFIGMGKDIYQKYLPSYYIFDLADEILGIHLKKLMFEGPEEALKLTENAQPAIYTVSYALFQVLSDMGKLPENIVAAGHSLGEYTALACAEVFSFEDGLRIVRERGTLMQSAVPEGEGAMFAILGLDISETSKIRDFQDVWISNINERRQIVISGRADAVRKATEVFSERGAKVRELKVSAPFHCPLMEPVKEKLKTFFNSIKISPPRFPVVSCHTAETYPDNPDEIVRILLDGITSPVRWLNCVLSIRGMGVTTFAEVGPGKVLSGLSKRILGESIKIFNVEGIDDIIILDGI